MSSNSDLLNSVLDSNVGASETAFAVRKDRYHELVALQNVSSYSTQQKLFSCPREYQLSKMEADLQGDQDKESNVDFAFGHAVGAGVAEYDKSQDLKKAYWAAFLAWNIDLLAAKERKEGGRDQKKSFAHALWALDMYTEFYQEEGLGEYEVAYTEAMLGVDLEDGNFYAGHVDTIFKHKELGSYLVKENKTTGFAAVDPALYANSDQGLGYSVVVSALGATEYTVLYCIYSTTEQRWIAMRFVKSPLAKAEWLQTQLLFGSEKDEYARINFFPRRGGSCFKFNRRCKYFETCDFDTERVFGKKFSDLKTIGSLDELDAIEHLDFRLTLTELIAHQEQELRSAPKHDNVIMTKAGLLQGMETL